MPHAETGAGAAVDPAELRTLAERLARTAGTGALAGRRSLPVGQPLAHDTKSSATDPVTEFDRSAEAYIVGELRRLRPDDAIVGEEGTDDTGTSGIEWHLDPIDGTTNFVYGLPSWCTSIAAVRSGEPITEALAGAIYLPVTDEMFSAHVGGGATLDGSTISASRVDTLALSLVATGFGYREQDRVVQAARMAILIPQMRDIRRSGSAAIDLALVACGRLDAYFEEHLNSWDVAAGLLIAREAGAGITLLDGYEAGKYTPITSSANVHEALLAAIAAAADLAPG